MTEVSCDSCSQTFETEKIDKPFGPCGQKGYICPKCSEEGWVSIRGNGSHPGALNTETGEIKYLPRPPMRPEDIF